MVYMCVCMCVKSVLTHIRVSGYLDLSHVIKGSHFQLGKYSVDTYGTPVKHHGGGGCSMSAKCACLLVHTIHVCNSIV